MINIKDFIENNKALAAISALTILIFIIGIIVCLKPEIPTKKSQKRELHENTYTMLIKSAPIVKITFVESYYQCGKNVCSDYTEKVTSHELMNDVAKSVYKDISINEQNLAETLSTLIEEAKKANTNLDSITLVSNWKTRYTEEELKKEIKKYNKEEISIPITFEYQQNLASENENEENEVKEYTITFDSALGSEVESQKVEENGKVRIPHEPTRDGYEFVEWQYNNRRFDFNTKVTKDLVLKARWKKLPTVSTSTTTTTTTNTNNSNSNNNEQEQTTTAQKTGINLNENVEYYTSTTCSTYIQVKQACLNKTYDQLMNEGSYSNEFNKIVEANPTLKDETLKLTSSYIKYFPSCYSSQYNDIIIPTLKNKKGFISENTNGKIKFTTLHFSNNKYSKYVDRFSYTDNNLVQDGECSSDQTSDVKILDEETCKKFKLTCDRW